VEHIFITSFIHKNELTLKWLIFTVSLLIKCVYVTSFQNRRKQNITRYRYSNFSAQNILHKWHCTPRGSRPHSLEWKQHAQHYGHVQLFCQQTELQRCRDEQHFNPAARAVDEYFRVPFDLRPATLQVCIIQGASFLYFLWNFLKNQTAK